MADEDEGLTGKAPLQPPALTSCLLYKIPCKRAENASQNLSPDSISIQKAPWIAAYGSQSTIAVSDNTFVELVDMSDVSETRNRPKEVIQTQNRVLAMAFSSCGEFLAVADDAGTLSLYRSNGTLVFGHRVVAAGGSDKVVAVKFASSEGKTSSQEAQTLVVVTKLGVLLQLGNLRLAEVERLLVDKPKDALSVILRTIEFKRTSVGGLKEDATSCLLVHQFDAEESIILGNHAAFLSVWKALEGHERTGIKKVSLCDSRQAPVEAMAFDANCSLLVILSEGKLTWWNWRDMTEMVEADMSGIMNFAVIRDCGDEQSGSLIAVARSTKNGRRKPLLELVLFPHPESDDAGAARVLSKMEPTEESEDHLDCTAIAIFASARDTSSPQALAVCRTDEGVDIVLLTSDDTLVDQADQSFYSESSETSSNTDPVVIAEALLDVPVAFLMQKRPLMKFQAKFDRCISQIGESDDESRAILKNLLRVAAVIREYTSSSPRVSSHLKDLVCRCDKVCTLSYKWTTFQLLRSSSSAEASGKSLREKWQSFQTVSVVEMLEKYIKLGSMRAVRILWGRHYDSAATRSIGKLLQYLPTSLPVSAFGSWIQSEVIPTLFRHEQAEASSTETTDPPVLIEVVLWLLERSEVAASKGDLDSAIQICNLIQIDASGDSFNGGVMSFYELKLQNSASYSAGQGRGAFERIERLAEKLRHVKRLAVEHHFIISLSVFEDETPATIAMSMLDRVLDPESLKKEIEDHVRTYLGFCDVVIDPVLHDYVTELAESIQCPQSAVEARILVLLDEIGDTDIRADATLALLRSALPPYSPALKCYANSCSQWKTERLEEIEEHVRLMEIQDMLTKYGAKQFDVADTKSASRLVSHILNQVSKPSALTDAMLLVDAYSDLHCDRVVVRYTENLLSDLDAMTEEVPDRVVKAMDALAEVKKRKEPKAHLVLYVALLEEIIEFGVMLLEMDAEEMEGSKQDLENGLRPQSFVLCMLKALVTAYLVELKTTLEIAGDAPDSVIAYVESPDYLLSDRLLADLQRICQVEVDYRVLLSIKLLRDPEECEKKFKQLINPKILFEDDEDQGSAVIPVTYAGRGKGKKRAVVFNTQDSSAAKRQRTSQNIRLQSRSGESQQDDARTRLIFDLNRFASVVGIDAKACQSLTAQSAAESGSVLQAVRFSRDLYSLRNFSVPKGSGVHAAEALKKIAISLSLYTSSHVKEVYDVAFTRNQKLLPAQVARVQAPMYTLELLRHALCMCEKETFDELLILLKNTMLVNEILQFTQHNSLTKSGQAQWELYPRWYRGDACALASYEAMKLVTRFAIAEHKNLRREVEDKDTIASKRYVSFLVEQRADLLSLQALMSMQELPEDAASVVNTQMGKLLSTVFQSQEIDNYLALGLLLSMKQEDAFHAFRRQISRENVSKDFNRFQQLAFIGADAARAWQQIAFLHQCVELEGNARWWHYLNLLDIECDHKAFQSERRDLQYIRRLVPTLMTRSNYDFYTVLEFTRHYQIEDSFPSLVYTEALLQGDFPDYQDKIAGVIDEIHEQHLTKLLLKSIPKVSGQDYDRLLFIFRLLLENTYREREEVERRMEILRNLKAFALQTSSSKSGEGKEKPGKVSFHELVAEPREVLARVVTKENFSAFMGLADPLRLEPDELQILLLKNMTSDLNQEGSAQFSAFEGILTCLSDTESRVTAAEWLAENFPLGDDKLKALEFALKAALSGQNGAEDPSNTSFTGHEALTRLENKILRVKVEVLLRNATSQTSSLAEIINDKEQTNQLLALVSEPKKLYLELYRRYALWFHTHSSDMLHEVAGSIGELLQLPQVKLRLELVRGWLVKDAVHVGKCNSNEAREDPFELLESEKLQQADDDFSKRILYMAASSVNAGDDFGEQILSYLVDFAKDSRPLAGVTYRAKMRALRVILRLGQLYHRAVERFVTTKYGIENSDPFFKELLEYTKHCTHMITFEEHRVPYDMTFVLKREKEVLTRSFLRRFPLTQPWVLRCASQLMLDFDVEAPDLWEDILTNMLELGMIRSLANILGPLSRKSGVRSLACARQVWEDVLTLPLIDLKNRHNQSSEEIEDSYFAGIPIALVRSVMERMVLLLERCPFLDQIDVPAFVIHLRDLAALAQESNGLEKMGLYRFAVKCAMVIPKPLARFEALMRIVQSGAHSAVLHELLDTSCFLDGESEVDEESGELADNYRLIQASFAEAAKREDYRSILDTPFEPGFIEYLAATGDIDFLLSLLLEDKRMEAALNALELYYEYHPSEAPLQTTKPNEEVSNNRWELIEAYLTASKSSRLERFRPLR
ncbi:hypothetical protein V7S43_012980 [Phytophthora oleae]|uniref:RZZ complex subunit KNTC1/ROD C-terminal domain-containing protein n=1 Tax=Phytophthora oleae TaxID=2107226 RepID=A0ABD3F865_9STRA